MKSNAVKLTKILCAVTMLWLAILAAQIVEFGESRNDVRGDVAIVLGASVYQNRPSLVFAERIKHAIDLYGAGRVRKIIFTGGYGEGSVFAEAIVARDFAVERGVSSTDILTETSSRTTRQNLMEAKRIMEQNGLQNALIVSDPLHLNRANRMAIDLGIVSYPEPTPTTRYRSFWPKAEFLFRELYFYNHYLIFGE